MHLDFDPRTFAHHIMWNIIYPALTEFDLSKLCGNFTSPLPSLFSPPLSSAWFSWTTRRLWATSWRSWWRRTTCLWPTRSASTCTRALASSSSHLSSRTCAPSAHPSPQCPAPPTQAPCPRQTKTGGQGRSPMSVLCLTVFGAHSHQIHKGVGPQNQPALRIKNDLHTNL